MEMDTSLDLLPEEQIAAVVNKSTDEKTRTASDSAIELLSEWNLILSRVLKVAASDGDALLYALASEDSKDMRERRDRVGGSPTVRNRPLGGLESTSESALVARRSHVAKKAHLMLFYNAACR